jgi:hypothetical protein
METVSQSKQKQNWGVVEVVRKLMGTGVHWEDEGEEEEGVVVGEFGSRMVANEWSMGEEALVKERTVTRRESTTFARGSQNSIAPELSLIQPISSYFHLAHPVLADQQSKQ